MKIPRYWQRELVSRTDDLWAFGWGFSETDPEEAKQRALENANRTIDFLESGAPSPGHDEYGYHDRVPREEIIREFTDSTGETNGFVSRNSYGSLILNARDLVFIDVDLPPPLPQSTVATILSLFGLGKQVASRSPAERTLAKIKEAATRFPKFGFRVYQTANGFRVMVTNEPLTSDSQIVRQMLDAFGADPLYVRMCRNQECFRARLTPKAWRCDFERPTYRYPFETSEVEGWHREWEAKYNEAVRGFSTCRLEAEFGPQELHPELESLIELHDSLTGTAHTKPLA